MTGAPGRGAAAERYANRFLERQGLRRITANYRCRRGEIDLVMHDGHTLVFVEVRYRRSNAFGGPLESVTRNKQRRIILAADHFLQTHPEWSDHPCRFDVIGIGGPAGETIEWVKDAFSSA